MAGFTPSGGRMLWDYPFKQDYEQTILTPAVAKGLVILGGKRQPLTALRVEGKAAVAWTNAALRAYTTTPVVFGDHLVGLNDRGDLVCVSVADGSTAWQRKAVSNYHGSLVMAGKRVLLLTSRGELLVFAADAKAFALEARWKVTDDVPCWGHLAVEGSRLYVRGKTSVICFDVR